MDVRCGSTASRPTKGVRHFVQTNFDPERCYFIWNDRFSFLLRGARPASNAPSPMPHTVPIEVHDPGDFVLPAGLVPITTLRVLRNQEGQPDELIFVLDRKLRPLLKGHKKLMLSLKGNPKQIEIDAKACTAPCSDQEPAKLGLRHLHLTMLPIPLIEIIGDVIRAL